jgi:hypothetical protein
MKPRIVLSVVAALALAGAGAVGLGIGCGDTPADDSTTAPPTGDNGLGTSPSDLPPGISLKTRLTDAGIDAASATSK